MQLFFFLIGIEPELSVSFANYANTLLLINATNVLILLKVNSYVLVGIKASVKFSPSP